MPKASKTISQSERRDRQAAYERLQHVVKLMQRNHVRDDWKPNLDEANHALAYFKGYAAGKPADQIDESRALYFLDQHGISIDYVVRGKLDVLLCRSIANSKAARKIEQDKAAEALADAKNMLSEMETSLHTSVNLGLALRAMATSDDVSRDIGPAIDAVADSLVETLRVIIAGRTYAWKRLGRPDRAAGA